MSDTDRPTQSAGPYIDYCHCGEWGGHGYASAPGSGSAGGVGTIIRISDQAVHKLKRHKSPTHWEPWPQSRRCRSAGTFPRQRSLPNLPRPWLGLSFLRVYREQIDCDTYAKAMVKSSAGCKPLPIWGIVVLPVPSLRVRSFGVYIVPWTMRVIYHAKAPRSHKVGNGLPIERLLPHPLVRLVQALHNLR